MTKSVGYKGIRAGTRKESVRRIFDRDGSDAARAVGEKLGLQSSTLRTWFSSWRSADGFEESEARWDAPLPERLDLQVGPGGRVVIPAVFRNAMQIGEGDRLMARVVEGELRLISPAMGVKRAQKMVRELIPGNDSLAEELIADRRREVKRETRDG